MERLHTSSIQLECAPLSTEQIYSEMFADRLAEDLSAVRPAEQAANDNSHTRGNERLGVASVGALAPCGPAHATATIPVASIRPTQYSAAELMGMTFPPTKSLVRNLIPQGLTLLAGKPKAGKSWLALDIAFAVATGGKVLSSEVAAAGDVLYAALEDSAQRMQGRLAIQRCGQPWPDNLTIWHEMRALDGDGEAELRNWIATHPRAKLIIIDVLNKVRPARRRNEEPYAYDYRSLEPLKKICDETGVSVIVVHHTRKAAADDVFDTVSGTLGLTGAPDMTVILTKDKSGSLTLAGQGRDIESFELGAKFDGSRCLTLSQLEASRGQSGSRIAIIRALKSGPQDCESICDQTGLKAGLVRSQLQRMGEKGEVLIRERGRYELPTAQPIHPEQQPSFE